MHLAPLPPAKIRWKQLCSQPAQRGESCIMHYICVFCGASAGARCTYTAAAQAVGRALARHGLGLVYGGGKVGLMGAVADAALAAGGLVIGVIPEPLATKEIAHDGLTELIVVSGMHERKALMAQKAAGFLT